MPAGPESNVQEVPIEVRQYKGTITSQNPAFIGPEYLQQSTDWAPDLQFDLATRNGTTAYLNPIPNTTHIDLLCYGQDAADVLYLVAVVRDTGSGKDILYVSIAGANFVTITGGDGGTFATPSTGYGFAFMGTTLYIGNDTDPWKEVTLQTVPTVRDLHPLVITSTPGVAPSAASDTSGADLTSGTYQYRWAVYDSVLKRWTKIGAAASVVITGSGFFHIVFTAPDNTASPALQANETWHLFLAGVDQSIEGAHDQTVAGLATSGTFTVSTIRLDSTVVPTPSTVTRTGNIMVDHGGRIYGSDGTPRYFATDVIAPGLEQAIFDQGTFFPANAFEDIDHKIRALFTGTVTTSPDQPSGPLAIGSRTSTWLQFGDIFDPSAQLEQLSAQIGPVGARAWCYTKLGVVFCALDSIYLLSQSGEPQDIGWPIWDQIRAIPRVALETVQLFWHKGFVKCLLPGSGTTFPTMQWWLDLRQGLGPTPSWWGPHSCPQYTTVGVTQEDDAEFDRAVAAVEGSGQVHLLDQVGSTTEVGAAMNRIARTARLDDSQPFLRKNLTRVRAIGQTYGKATLGVTINADGVQVAQGPMVLTGTDGAEFNTAIFNQAEFGSAQVSEGWYITPAPRPRATSFEVALTYQGNTRISLRDIEAVYLPVGRAVGPAVPM
jgi:hypothetical protein